MHNGLNNLIVNAIKYTPKGFVKYGYNIKDNEICFFVSDSGIGISAEYQESVFEHFYKIELETTKLYRGAGIGLAICKKLVNLFNGRIWVESELNKGSSFYFTIPCHSNSAKAQMTKDKVKIGTSFNWQDLFLVIAEDEIANYEVLTKMLRVPHDRHFWAKNGKEAVDFIKGLNTHEGMIVLMDIKMPIMNGVEAMMLIKSINDKIPVVAVTAFALKHEEKDFLYKGFDGFIAKPFNTENLKHIIAKYTI